MTYTEDQKREALAWAEYSHEPSMIPGDAWAASSVRALKRLASALRLAESELAEARRDRQTIETLNGEYVEKLSALRAENEALKKAADNFRMHHIGCGWRESAEAAEAKNEANERTQADQLAQLLLRAERSEREVQMLKTDQCDFHLGGCHAFIDHVEKARKAAEAKLAAMTPVVEAAKQWADWVKAEEGECGNSSGNQLRRNVAALRKSRASEAGIKKVIYGWPCECSPASPVECSPCALRAALAGE